MLTALTHPLLWSIAIILLICVTLLRRRETNITFMFSVPSLFTTINSRLYLPCAKVVAGLLRTRTEVLRTSVPVTLITRR